MWAEWLHHPCCLVGPQQVKAGDNVITGDARGRFGYIFPAVSEISNAPERRTKSEEGPHVGRMPTSPLLSRWSPKSQSRRQRHCRARMWAVWLHLPCCLGDLQRFEEEDKIKRGPICGRFRYITLAVSGIPNALKRWTNQNTAHMWADWLHHPCCLGAPQRSKAVDKIKIGPTCGRIGYITLAVSGVPNAAKQGTKSKVGQHVGGLATSPLLSRVSPTLRSGGRNQNRAHMWAVWLHHPCCLGGPQRFKAEDKIRIGPTCGRFGYITLAVSGIPDAPKRGTKSDVAPHVGELATSPLLSRGFPMLQSGGQNQNGANMWADWLHHPCSLAGPQCFGAGDNIRRQPTRGRIGYITLAVSGGQNASGWETKKRRGPTCGRVGYITLAVLGVPNTLERGLHSLPRRNAWKPRHMPVHSGPRSTFRSAAGRVQCPSSQGIDTIHREGGWDPPFRL